MSTGRPDPLHDLQDEVRHVRDLVLLRDLLRARGATAAELQEYAATIGRARTRLAEASKRASTPYAAAAA